MATTKTKPLSSGRRRRKKRPLAAAPKRRRHTAHHHHHRTGRRRRLSSGGFGGMLGGPMIKNNGAAALGGLGMTFVDMAVERMEKGKEKKSELLKWAVKGLFVIALVKFKKPFMAAGAAGVLGQEVGAHMLRKSGMLHDNLEEHEYVDPRELSDSGMEDEMGDPITMDANGYLYSINDEGKYVHNGWAMDEEGNRYALNDHGEYEYRDTLHDDGSLADYNELQGVTLRPLTPGYERHQR